MDRRQWGPVPRLGNLPIKATPPHSQAEPNRVVCPRSTALQSPIKLIRGVRPRMTAIGPCPAEVRRILPSRRPMAARLTDLHRSFLHRPRTGARRSLPIERCATVRERARMKDRGVRALDAAIATGRRSFWLWSASNHRLWMRRGSVPNRTMGSNRS